MQILRTPADSAAAQKNWKKAVDGAEAQKSGKTEAKAVTDAAAKLKALKKK